MLIAGPFGELAGGLLNDRLGKRSPAAVLQAVAVVSLVTIPVGLAMLLVSSVGMAMTFLVIWRLLATVFVPPTWALSQALVRPDQRATSQALTGMAGNLLGYGCGPAVTGWLSELLRPFYGNDSLRWAIVASLTLFGLAAAVVYARAARNLRRMN
jgi:MFS family permease